jgi:N-acetyl-anhydromuramoyl-L-alanine amidase
MGVTIDLETGWLRGVRRVESPNQDARPAGAELDLIVVHGISLPPGQFGNAWIDRFFCNDLPADADPYFTQIVGLKVSAHALIDRAGTTTQYVPFTRRAWHAGQSSYCGRAACNDFSIGIELEGTDDTPYATPQYAALAALIRALRAGYPSLQRADVVGHSDIAPGRKTDPGEAFDWPRLNALLERHGRS